MHIALKYGLLTTSVLIVWVSLTRFIFPIDAGSSLNLLAPVLFNLAAILFIFLGIRQRTRESGGTLSFKDGLKTGVGISAVYGATASLFFLFLMLMVGPEFMSNESLAADRPFWQAALLAYSGLFFGALFLGLVYSAVISFGLALQRRSSLRQDKS